MLPCTALGRADAASSHFHGAVAPRSVIGEVVARRLNAMRHDLGHDLCTSSIVSKVGRTKLEMTFPGAGWAATLNFVELRLHARHGSTIAAGAAHSIFVSDGQCLTSGAGRNGRLGHGTNANLVAPQPVAALERVRVRHVAAGYAHSLCIDADDCVYSWGCGAHGRLGQGGIDDLLSPRRVSFDEAGQKKNFHVQVAEAADEHSIFVMRDGSVYTCGNGMAGRLGHGNEHSVHSPKAIEVLLEANVRIVGAAGGLSHSLLHSADGHLWSFGSGRFGQLGLC